MFGFWVPYVSTSPGFQPSQSCRLEILGPVPFSCPVLFAALRTSVFGVASETLDGQSSAQGEGRKGLVGTVG